MRKMCQNKTKSVQKIKIKYSEGLGFVFFNFL